MDSKTRRPSSEPRIDSEALSGWGMRPKIFLEVFTIPAIFSREPLGLAASVTFPFSST